MVAVPLVPLAGIFVMVHRWLGMNVLELLVNFIRFGIIESGDSLKPSVILLQLAETYTDLQVVEAQLLLVYAVRHAV